MNLFEIILIVLIFGYCGFLIYRRIKNRDKKGCGGNCSCCNGCPFDNDKNSFK
ncbi:MAG: FeoB-associated Cys-rich membrane protein [Hominimerdicola sp.]